MTEPIENTADAIMTLINSKPRSPTRDEIIECLLRSKQLPGMRVIADQHGDVYFVSSPGDFDDLRAAGNVRTWGAFP